MRDEAGGIGHLTIAGKLLDGLGIRDHQRTEQKGDRW